MTDSNPHSCYTFTVFKTANYSFRTLLVVVPQGFEPRLSGPKPLVLRVTLGDSVEQVTRLELASPVWKTGALTIVLYLLM